MKNKLKNIISSMGDEEAGLLGALLIKSLQEANHQTVKYEAEELKDQNQETLMVNVDTKVTAPKNILEKLIARFK